MALTIADATGVENNFHVAGDLRLRFLKITLDDDYATGGYDLTAAQLGLSRVEFALVAAGIADADVVVSSGVYLPATNKLVLYDADSELANSANVAGATIHLLVFGK